MFERFTAEARDTVSGAVTQARSTGAARVTEEHLLLALLELGALDPLGVDRASVAASLAEARRRGGMSKADEEALAGLGIDLSEIIARVEETHGEGALAAAGGGTRGGRLRSALGEGGGHVRFGPGAKKTLEHALRIAVGRRDKSITRTHLLLALLSAPGPVADVLTAHGVTYARTEAAVPPAA
ncbi:Clp protease N-terminal domain-containing protein [Streptomyces sp. G-G2]|uniref:Clp protease N-terminal domain-containing protein n=1 Tax=Streptomyces sp. G-G2 TaxID=3046201 RepID=UPI0024BBAFFF|nr:Clp protease N-terminal domain-containing protein [Streptomyces sp. G-G2]MDJ0379280.1 Clp protease N-terminal domain-containing protein [Streptomyces sp. G-G2]